MAVMTPTSSLTAAPYPPAPSAAPSATPERTAALNSRGTIVPAVGYIMYVLQAIYPRRIFPDVGGTQDQQRRPVICPIGWRRGGTSPSGASLGGTPGGNYFIGSPERPLNDSAPQRIIWEPPGVGEEEWAPPQQMGPYKDVLTTPQPDLLIPQSPITGDQYRQMDGFATGQIATRIIPMRAHIWGNDFDDTEELTHWLGSAAQVCFNGNTSVAGVPLLGPSGWAEDEKGSRGLHQVLTIRLAAPIHFPYWAEREAVAAALRFSGAAPNTVVG